MATVAQGARAAVSPAHQVAGLQRESTVGPQRVRILLGGGPCHGVKSSFYSGANATSFRAATFATSAAAAKGGALNAQMNIFDRVARIVKSYTNAALSSLEDPEKILDQAVEDMQTDAVKLRQATAQVLASTKQLENKYRAAQQSADDWYKRAKLALSKGEEELAKEALKRRKDYEENARNLESQLAQQQATVDKLIGNTRILEGKIQEARAKKDTLKARAQSAKTQQKVNDMLGGISTNSSMAAFEKMEEKVIALEAESDAVGLLAADDLSSKFAQLEAGSVDDDLAALKRDMLGDGGRRPAELPSGRSSARQLELESELNELRRRTQEY
ncbi:hypothetical protein CLOM_g6656 [Closterium sp. NIES-68]|nr:hypothetical protein CLOM_g6656 [Closterium sp. NIES-68]GJP85610.1 hypothetical protein CLOP_g15714 [Closterium sp. NIES-67]